MIHLWRTDRLVNVLVNEQLTETDSRNYMVVSALIYTYIIYSGLWFGGSREWMLLFEAVMTLGICVVGINECFKANGGSAGTQFLIRFCALSVPVLFKLSLAGIAVSPIMWYGFPYVVDESNFRNPDLVYRISIVMVALVFAVLNYWRIAHHLAAIQSLNRSKK